MKGIASKYDGLYLSDEFIRIATEQPYLLKELCNGVGSKVGWAKIFYPLIPNTIWFLDITPASDIHDVDYVYPKVFQTRKDALKHKEEADWRFYLNCKILIERNTKSRWLKYMRLTRARNYYRILKSCGMESFLEGKTIIEEL